MILTDNRFAHLGGKATACYTEFARYDNGQTALLLKEQATDEDWYTVSVAVREDVPSDCIVIKDYSENEGTVAMLSAAGVIEPSPIRLIRSGFVQLPVHRLTAAALAELHETSGG